MLCTGTSKDVHVFKLSQKQGLKIMVTIFDSNGNFLVVSSDFSRCAQHNKIVEITPANVLTIGKEEDTFVDVDDESTFVNIRDNYYFYTDDNDENDDNNDDGSISLISSIFSISDEASDNGDKNDFNCWANCSDLTTDTGFELMGSFRNKTKNRNTTKSIYMPKRLDRIENSNDTDGSKIAPRLPQRRSSIE
jgi:hypothetical protein